MRYWRSPQDEEDYAEDCKIREWLSTKEGNPEFDFKFINRNGHAKNTLVRAKVSLDQPHYSDEPGGNKFHDVIPGSDGRDLYKAEDPDPESIIDIYLACLGFDEEKSEWILKKLKWSAEKSKLLSRKSRIDLEW